MNGYDKKRVSFLPLTGPFLCTQSVSETAMPSIGNTVPKEMPPKKYVAAAPALVDTLFPLNSSSCATELSVMMEIFHILSHTLLSA